MIKIEPAKKDSAKITVIKESLLIAYEIENISTNNNIKCEHIFTKISLIIILISVSPLLIISISYLFLITAIGMIELFLKINLFGLENIP